VQFLDLRFVTLGVRRAPVLAGYVVLDPNLNVMDMYVGERK
jgi:hypothetical protein